MTASRRTEEYLRIDGQRIFHPFYPVGANNGVILTEGHGLVLKDTEGKEYLDFTSGLVCVNVGHGRTEIADAVREQMGRLDFYQIFYGFSNVAIVELAEYLAGLLPPGLGHFFFCNGGSEANESAFKLARQYWRVLGQDKYKIVGLEYAYHGLTFGAMSATSLRGAASRRLFGPTLPGFLSIPTYYCYRCKYELAYPACGIRCADGLAEAIEREGPETVAAFLGEPVHGSAGMIAPPPEFWPKVRRICDEYGVLLIGDEVMTGFGRTGKLFALEHFGVVPDIMTMAKGLSSSYLPFAATAVSDRIFEAFKGPQPFLHGYTATGHPVCAAASLANLKIIFGEKLVENAARMGSYLMNRLQELRSLEHVGDVAGLGLMCAVELVADRETKAQFDPALAVSDRVVASARDRGIIFRNFADRIGIAPPLCVTAEQIDHALDVLKSVIAKI